MATSNNGGGNGEGGGGYAGGGLASGDGKVGLWIAIGLGVLVIGGAVIFFFVK